MRSAGDWLAARQPPPPPDLAAALETAQAGSADSALTQAGLGRLSEARARPGRVRDSAFRLLEADALLTYACEAALESDDPVGALQRIRSAVGS